MAKRPEGLSPCYNSLASPDIPESHFFRWEWSGQTSATITIYDTNKTTVLKTYNVSGSTQEVDMATIGYTFTKGKTYWWKVKAQNSQDSVVAKFLYDACPVAPTITWNHIPQPGDVIVSNTYFEEIKTNVNRILSDYDNVPNNLVTSVNSLFTDGTVPSRNDFRTLESVIDYLSITLEDTSSIDVDGPVLDSLGVTDLEAIRNHIDRLITIKPLPMSNLSIDIPEPTMYKVYGIDVKNDGRTDPMMDVTWSVEPVPNYNGKITFGKVSPSRDVRYYRAIFEYGPSNNPFSSELYYKKENMYNGRVDTFETNWDGIYTASTLGLAKQSLQVFTVDHRGNESNPVTVTKTFGSNFKAPLGVDYYELSVQKAPLSDTAPDKNGKWATVAKPTKTSHTHKVSGGENRIYLRVRAVDYSGLMTDWIYDNGITFDPLLPPDTPKNFRVHEARTTSLVFRWDAAARATSYEFRAEKDSANIDTGTDTQSTGSGLKPNTKYDFFVRAKNRVGYSNWASVVGKTKSARATKEKTATKGKSWNSGYNSIRTGRRIEGPHWRTEGDGLVYQGEWVEIQGSPHQSGPAGQGWGKHKGMWIFDSAYWRNTLKGKKIIKVEIWVKRKGYYHGYYDDQTPTFWLHNYDNFPKGEPSFFSKYKPSKDFDLGESGWVTLPNSYGEQIRDNKAKGIGIYVDKSGRLPYIKFYDNAKLRITYE